MLEEKDQRTGLSLISEKIGRTYTESLRQIFKFNIRNKTLSGLDALDGVFIYIQPETLEPVGKLTL